MEKKHFIILYIILTISIAFNAFTIANALFARSYECIKIESLEDYEINK